MKENKIIIGSHVEFKAPDYLFGAAKTSYNNKANAMMIYLGAPQNSKRVNVSKYKIEEYKRDFEKIIVPENIIVHAPYITNCANPDKFDFATDFLIEEIRRMSFFGAKYLVLHPGAFTTFSKEIAYEILEKALIKILDQTENVVIALETMSGKGTEIGTKINELTNLIEKIKSPRLALCLDTCHVWDAGYDIKNLEVFINHLEEIDALKYIKVIHLNDSKNDIFSKKDRHENIGKGFIGFETLQKIVFHEKFKNIPIILETPWVENIPIYDKEIKLLLGQ
ncbi:deoxyribonuclease IV [[Mycoplasma] mobile]|uniref:Probable endonuclease 4 n=1 Tax=Mycoplasma mobile (strain ATCC 43663 / 163K / NCTC 11711) TaxID=267748 RepID=END4_MYCM1|nr:deoxyribonuclease IV [[Mycoplasma] mobile]Q6KH96.1 RecName: Full=Probable endonuclease 4; AltName: Full=Endodeoxyribonuclease IV; AltName: Full=Endonuclease IV [Mycoplasma mobile 163K]AAT28034.1 endonuclease IV [Mycoplasma mobile 163K]